MLGLTVVFLLNEDDEPLLRAHLHMIRHAATLPYRVYGSANRMPAGLLPVLEKYPEVVLCDVPTTEHRGAAEHSYHLSHLFDRALQDGATHLCALHVDSFPVRHGWDADMVALLAAGNALVAPPRVQNVEELNPHCACLFFSTDFWKHYRPFPALPKVPSADPDFERHRARGYVQETGEAFGYWVMRDSLKWHRLLRTNVHEDHPSNGTIYGDTIFHLGGNASGGALWSRGDMRSFRSSRLRRMIRNLPGMGRAPGVPMWLKRLLLPHEARRYEDNRRAFELIKQRLFSDPVQYTEYLRGLRDDPPDSA